MIPIALMEKFSSKYVITCMEVRDMTRSYNKLNRLRNVNTVLCRTGNVPIQKKENLQCPNQNDRAFHKFWMKQIRLKWINVQSKMGLGIRSISFI